MGRAAAAVRARACFWVSEIDSQCLSSFTLTYNIFKSVQAIDSHKYFHPLLNAALDGGVLARIRVRAYASNTFPLTAWWQHANSKTLSLPSPNIKKLLLNPHH